MDWLEVKEDKIPTGSMASWSFDNHIRVVSEVQVKTESYYWCLIIGWEELRDFCELSSSSHPQFHLLRA